MNPIFWALGIAVLLAVGLAAYLLTARKYESPASVAKSYDEWTRDGILEFYWGEHIHLGHYGSPPQRKNFLQAKHDFVHEMVRWGGVGSTACRDNRVGCGLRHWWELPHLGP